MPEPETDPAVQHAAAAAAALSQIDPPPEGLYEVLAELDTVAGELAAVLQRAASALEATSPLAVDDREARDGGETAEAAAHWLRGAAHTVRQARSRDVRDAWSAVGHLRLL